MLITLLDPCPICRDTTSMMFVKVCCFLFKPLVDIVTKLQGEMKNAVEVKIALGMFLDVILPQASQWHSGQHSQWSPHSRKEL